MARNYPGTTRMQNFYMEEYDNEMHNRLRWYNAKQRGGEDARPQIPQRGGMGFPEINPGKFAREMVRRERQERERTIAEVKRTQSKKEMSGAPRDVKEKLYDGFSKEGKGRQAYLKDRYDVLPEQKYAFPVLSSWQYGWQLDSATTLKKPQHARSRKVLDTFYTRNGIPDISTR